MIITVIIVILRSHLITIIVTPLHSHSIHSTVHIIMYICIIYGCLKVHLGFAE
jgi:hypothetical protein